MKSLVAPTRLKPFTSLQLVAFLLIAALAVCAYVLPVHAVNFITVDRTDDAVVSGCTNAANDCTLRGALTIAAAGDQISFDTTVFPTNTATTINVTSALPVLSQGILTIQGHHNSLGGAAVVLNGAGAGVGVNGLTITSNNN